MIDNSRIDALVTERMKKKTPEQLAKLEEGRRQDEAFKAIYDRVEEAEHALDKYELTLTREQRVALYKDHARHEAVISMFFGARSPELLEKYSKMTVDELVTLRNQYMTGKA